MKAPKLSIVKINNISRYRIAYTDADGIRKREHLTIKSEALARLKYLKDEHQYDCIAGSALTVEQRLDYLQCLNLINGTNVKLIDIVKIGLEKHNSMQVGVDLRTAINQFIEEKSLINEQITMRNIKSRLNLFFTKIDLNIKTTEITTDLIQTHINQYDNTTTQTAFKKTLASFFNFCLRKKYVNCNPCTDIIIKKSIEKDVEYLTIEETKNLLENCPVDFKNCLAIGLFCGLRKSELIRLNWDNIDIQQKTITLGANITKTAQRRVVVIPDNLLTFLSKDPQTADLIPDTEYQYSYYMNIACEAAGYYYSAKKANNQQLKKWKTNCIRHSYISYRLAQCQNFATVSYEAGNSPDVIKKHYHGLVSKQQAQQYFDIAI